MTIPIYQTIQIRKSNGLWAYFSTDFMITVQRNKEIAEAKEWCRKQNIKEKNEKRISTLWV